MGATHHLTKKYWLSDYTLLAIPTNVCFGNNKNEISARKKEKQFKIGNVYFVPGITKNLLFVRQNFYIGTFMEPSLQNQFN